MMHLCYHRTSPTYKKQTFQTQFKLQLFISVCSSFYCFIEMLCVTESDIHTGNVASEKISLMFSLEITGSQCSCVQKNIKSFSVNQSELEIYFNGWCRHLVNKFTGKRKTEVDINYTFFPLVSQRSISSAFPKTKSWASPR